MGETGASFNLFQGVAMAQRAWNGHRVLRQSGPPEYLRHVIWHRETLGDKLDPDTFGEREGIVGAGVAMMLFAGGIARIVYELGLL